MSVEPGSTLAGTSVRPTLKRTVQRPFAAGRSGTVSQRLGVDGDPRPADDRSTFARDDRLRPREEPGVTLEVHREASRRCTRPAGR